jgi:GNAT superfamily N-acetyltransferase
MDIIITTARIEDVPDLIASAAALFREDAGRRDPHVDVEWATRNGLGYYADMVTNPKSLALLARVGAPDGLVVGHLTGQVRQPNEVRPTAAVAELVSIRVAEETRGQGVGARLVDEFLAWAKNQGANQAIVSAFASNHDAIRFYEVHGFAPMNVSLQIGL